MRTLLKAQIWIAIGVYVLLAIIKKELEIKLHLSEILQIPSIVLFEKALISEVFYEKLCRKTKIFSFVANCIIQHIMGWW